MLMSLVAISPPVVSTLFFFKKEYNKKPITANKNTNTNIIYLNFLVLIKFPYIT